MNSYIWDTKIAMALKFLNNPLKYLCALKFVLKYGHYPVNLLKSYSKRKYT